MRCYFCGCDVNPASARIWPMWFGSAYCCKQCYIDKYSKEKVA